MYTRHTLFQVVFSLLTCLLSAPTFAAPSDHFVTRWKTNNLGTSNTTSITVPIVGGPYDVDWDNDGVFDEFGLTGSITHNFGVVGAYTIRIQGVYDSIRFNNGGDKEKILFLLQWGTNSWLSMNAAFYGATNLQFIATDIPDFSLVTDMSSMFSSALFANPNTNAWDTSSVTNMSSMFKSARLANPDTSAWDTSSVTNMSSMFGYANLANPDTSAWDTSSVTDMSWMFSSATRANPDTSGWDTSAVKNMAFMFTSADSANPDSSRWNTSTVTDMSGMFSDADLANPDTSSWDTSSVRWMHSMFHRATSANPDTSGWDTSRVTYMLSMFEDAFSANPDTSGWDTSAVTNMRRMFMRAFLANPDTSDWDTSRVMYMKSIFEDAISANPDTSGWNTSRVREMDFMFSHATSANPDTSEWDTSAVTNMGSMFQGTTSANPDTSKWDTSSVTNTGWMFVGAVAFNRDISSWDVSSLRGASFMFGNVSLSTANYDSLLISWNAQALKPGVSFHGGYSTYCSVAAQVARANLIAVHDWNISDGGQECPSAPATPIIGPDLTPATDTGVSDSDNITANSSPQFEVVCSATNNSITLYTDKPTVNTAIGTHVCTSVGPEIASTTTVIGDGTHNITYIDQHIGERSGHSPSLAVTIDTITPTGPGNLTAPGSPINDVNANVIGSCGANAANDTVVVTTSPANGFTTLYNSPNTLDGSGGFSIVDPNWSEGAFIVTLECSDIAGNSATLGPFGPILIDLSCSGVDTVVTGDFLAGMHLCAGTNSLETSGNVNLESGAVVYFQSPELTLNAGFNVSEGASLISSSVVGSVAPLLLGPTQIKASVGEVLVFSETHICEDNEDGMLAIAPLDTGVLVESAEPEVFTLSCTDFSGITTQLDVTVSKD